MAENVADTIRRYPLDTYVTLHKYLICAKNSGIVTLVKYFES